MKRYLPLPNVCPSLRKGLTLFFLIFFILLDPLYIHAQLTFNNPSFEGTTAGADKVAPGWTKCAATPDVQPGIWCVNIPPFSGSRYAGLCSGEYIGQLLPTAFNAGTTYTFTLRLAHDLNYYAAMALGVCATPRPNPGALEVWAGNSSCTETALLWSSPAISSTTWTLYKVTFTPAANYNYIMLECNGSNANVLVDSIQSVITPLPSQLLYFTGNANDGLTNLNWATGAEINSLSFTLERSNNAIDFVDINTLPAAGNSVALRTYSAIDHNPESGVNYYRLKQTDNDGSSMYSEVLALKIADKENRFIPGTNPVKQGENLTFKYVLNQPDIIEVGLYDIMGRSIYHTKTFYESGENTIAISSSSLIKGIYFLKATSGKQVNTIKIEIAD